MSWKNKLSFLSVKPTVSKVGGADINFYPISLGLAFRLRNVAKPLALALQQMFSNDRNDFGSTQKTVQTPDGTQSEVVMSPITPELASLRTKQAADSLSALIDGLTAEENLKVIGELVMDSMRDTFPKGDNSNPPALEFINTVELPNLMEMIVGVIKANKGVFGPLERKMEDWMGMMKKKVEAQVAARVERNVESQTPPPNPTPTTGG